MIIGRLIYITKSKKIDEVLDWYLFDFKYEEMDSYIYLCHPSLKIVHVHLQGIGASDAGFAWL